MRNIIIFGGALPAIASADKAASTAMTVTVYLIVPYVLYVL